MRRGDMWWDPTAESLRNLGEIYIEGNKGGDYLRIALIKDNIVQLEIGHCCIVTISHEIPVEILTSILSKATDYGHFEDLELEWDDEFSQKLKAQVKKINEKEK